MTLSRRLLLIVAAVACPALAGGCNSPTLPPLPPPSEPRVIEQVSEDEVRVSGSIPVEEALLLMLNTDTDDVRGVFTHDGTYDLVLPARTGNFIHLWYSTEGLDSPLYRFTIPEFDEPFTGERAEPETSGDDVAATEQLATDPSATAATANEQNVESPTAPELTVPEVDGGVGDAGL